MPPICVFFNRLTICPLVEVCEFSKKTPRSFSRLLIRTVLTLLAVKSPGPRDALVRWSWLFFFQRAVVRVRSDGASSPHSAPRGNRDSSTPIVDSPTSSNTPRSRTRRSVRFPPRATCEVVPRFFPTGYVWETRRARGRGWVRWTPKEEAPASCTSTASSAAGLTSRCVCGSESRRVAT